MWKANLKIHIFKFILKGTFVDRFFQKFVSNSALCDLGHFSSFKMSVQSEESSLPTNPLLPPSEVCGMKTLDRDAFKKTVDVPYVLVPVENIREAVKALKPCFLKMPNLQPIQGVHNEKKIILHPHLFDRKLPYLQNVSNKLNLGNVLWTKLDLTYENWNADSIFKAVLPPDSTGNVSSFSIVGHIIHLNLKPDLMDYKYLIGQVLLDKYSNIKTVVNKSQIIENEYRNLNMELLAGEPSYEVITKENNCQYAFDFSKVFWNPRLVQEHSLIVKKIEPMDLVYDVFAGVGPFSVPLAKKKCHVHANDLNPDSFHWLCHNAKLNKVAEYLHTYNLDGKEFIMSVIKNGLIEFWNKEDTEQCRIHIIMNLPACALEFLVSFRGLLCKQNLKNIGEMPTVYCYFFLRKDEEASGVIGKYLDDHVRKNVKVTTVRLVAPNKMMMRIEYKIPKSVLFQEDDEVSEPSLKKMKHNDDDSEKT